MRHCCLIWTSVDRARAEGATTDRATVALLTYYLLYAIGTITIMIKDSFGTRRARLSTNLKQKKTHTESCIVSQVNLQRGSPRRQDLWRPMPPSSRWKKKFALRTLDTSG